MKNRAALQEVVKGLPGDVYWNESLGRHTSLKIGGPADLLMVPASLSVLRDIVVRCRRLKIPLFVMGGTNLLVRDAGIRGVVVKLSSCQEIRQLGKMEIEAEAGALMPMVSRFAASRGLTGFEFALGIPGTIGGAVVMNAGTPDGDISSCLSQIRIVGPDGVIEDFPRKALSFGYRESRLPQGIIAGVRLSLKKGRAQQMRRLAQQTLEYRRKTQPLKWPNAGSVFKNPNGHKAAEIIEGVGLKGSRVGGAVLSRQHSNFIINEGRAKARDVIRLIRIIGKKVEQEVGLTLELELKIVGRD